MQNLLQTLSRMKDFVVINNQLRDNDTARQTMCHSEMEVVSTEPKRKGETENQVWAPKW